MVVRKFRKSYKNRRYIRDCIGCFSISRRNFGEGMFSLRGFAYLGLLGFLSCSSSCAISGSLKSECRNKYSESELMSFIGRDLGIQYKFELIARFDSNKCKYVIVLSPLPVTPDRPVFIQIDMSGNASIVPPLQ